jgi:nitrous oxidase accessory protein NosD
MYVKYVLVGLCALLVVASGSFAATPGGDRDLSPVPFDETVQVGLTGVDVREAAASGYQVPRAEVFYSQYQYVIGYYGVGSAASALAGDRHRRQFGRPFAVFVSDFSGTGLALTDEGYVRVREGANVGWVAAEDAVFVVDSGARTPGAPAVLPFGDRAAARSFARETGGRIVDWEAVAGELDDRASQRDWRETVAERSAWADRTVRATRALTDRPVSVVVGTDAPTLDAAVAAAPPNTTVRLPPGTVRAANLTIRKPLTLTGAGRETTIRGPSNGSVLQVRSPGVAVTDLRVTGVGPNGTSQEAPAEKSGSWDARVLAAYGYGDAAVVFDGANGSLVRDVRIDTPASGVVVRESDGVVVTDSRVNGSGEWTEGFMGVMTMRSRVVVQDSVFDGGRDGVYTHRAHGTVVRNNRMTDLRFGVHEMYTSRTLVRGNAVRDANMGVVVMTRPTGNAVVGNDVRESRIGVSAVGSGSLIAANRLVDNEYGLYVNAYRSRYVRNTVVGNDVGVRADTIFPTNDVVGNDVVGNERQVMVRGGPVRFWSVGGEGNYWGEIPLRDDDGDGVTERSYYPTGAVDRHLGRTAGAETVAESPTASLVRSLRASLPGLRAAGVVDEAPRTRPVRPGVLANVTDATGGGGGVPA